VRQTLSCAMTHIGPRMKEDSLLFLDVLVQNCNSALAKDSHKILPNFLGMYVVGYINYRNLPQFFVVNYRKLCTGTRSIMPLFVNLDEDMISIDNCEKETLFIKKIFRSFVMILPSLLLKPSIDDIVIRIIS
ncbi:hypothetical protein ALC57_01013, partial [Trachymyrmex cornetzi]